MSIVGSVYNSLVRPRLPRRIGVRAGVAVRCDRLLDAEDNYPDYKQGLIDGIHDAVSDGDSVTLVGGGRGVSTVHCLRAGASTVASFEAAEEMLTLAQETVELNDPEGDVEWRHALVGEGIEVYGEMGDADVVAPADLNYGDVLVLDCEGAERSILAGMAGCPPTVVVETHPERGVPTDVTESLLDDAGYLVDSFPFEPDHHEPDKRVLVGVIQ